MWKLFFVVSDFLCNLIPRRARREYVRREYLHDWRKKYNALRAAFPELKFRHTKIIKGGWNIGFIVDKKYVFKIRKKFDDNIHPAKVLREKRITDAFADISPLQIPVVDIVRAGEYTFFKYNFIPGRNLTTLRPKIIMKYRDAWATQIAEFINAVHNARPAEIDDLRTSDGDGWNHHDICNNIIVNMRTKKIIGLIDWEYAGWGPLATEMENTQVFSKVMREIGFRDVVEREYKKLQKSKKKS